MGKNLYLLRHAQAQEKESGEKDLERALDSTGLQNASKMGMHFLNSKIRFDIIITSPADRAYTTAQLISEQMKSDTSRIHTNEAIYDASVRTLLQVVNQLKDTWSSVLLVGHNPPITYLSEYLSKAEIGNIATCGVAHLSFKTDKWEKIAEGKGKLIHYEDPSTLDF